MPDIPRVSGLLDANEAAELLGCTPSYVRTLAYNGILPYVRLGRLLRFDPEDLERHIDTCRVPARGSTEVGS